MTQFTVPSPDAIEVLRVLREQNNVLIYGPPASGKSRLLAEVRHWFATQPAAGAVFAPAGPNAFPVGANVPDVGDWLPSPDRAQRKVYSTTFHQGTKYRDFVCGIAPGVGVGAPQFVTTRGPFVEAAEYALQPTSTSLVTIDEINRGPAVAIFGDLVTAIEHDKRLATDGTVTHSSVAIRVLNTDGTQKDMYLSKHLYVVGAMNEADTSVEPLDVAFKRRFYPYPLLPDEDKVRRFLGLPAAAAELPEQSATVQDVYEAAVRAWGKVNRFIALARGAEFQLGHGVFMGFGAGAPTVPEALSHASRVWHAIVQHAREVFFGDVRGLATVLAAGNAGSPYGLEEELFADAPVARLTGASSLLAADRVYGALRAVSLA